MIRRNHSRGMATSVLVTLVGVVGAVLVIALISAFLFYGPSPRSRAREVAPAVMDRSEIVQRMSENNRPNYVDVRLDNDGIDMPRTLPPGPTRFLVQNNSDDEHNFVIKGNGIEQTFKYDFKPYQTMVLSVALAPGDYSVYCPISGHENMTMRLNVSQ